MATGAPMTLLDLARRTDPDGDAADIAELLSQANDIYDDIVWKEGNTNTGHVFTVRTGLPAGTWRFINQGVPMSKSTTAQGRINCGQLTGLSVIDKRLLEMERDQNKYRYEEDNAFLEGMSQTIASTFIYGNNIANLAQFTGLSPFYNTLETATAANAVNVFQRRRQRRCNNASIWLIGWSPRSIYAVYPRGTAAGLKGHAASPSTEVALRLHRATFTPHCAADPTSARTPACASKTGAGAAAPGAGISTSPPPALAASRLTFGHVLRAAERHVEDASCACRRWRATSRRSPRRTPRARRDWW